MNKVFILLDSSESMTKIWDNSISGIKEFVSSIEDKESTHIELSTFNGLQRAGLAAGLSGLDNLGYPKGMTPLYDNIYKMYIRALEAGIERTSFVIVTDGEENTSKTYTAADVQSFVKTAKEKNWPVTFVGAGLDKIVSEGSRVGLERRNTIAYDANSLKHTKAAFNRLAVGTMSYATTGDVQGTQFTENERGSYGLAT